TVTILISYTTLFRSLDDLGTNVTDQARVGKIDPVIGRDEEIKRTMETLNRRNKNNPVLIGEPGVGKTAMAEGLALKIIEGDVPADRKSTRLNSSHVS